MSLEIILNTVRVSRGGVPILDGVSWRLAPGGRAALIGGNGAGKSTLLSLARGDIWPDQRSDGSDDGERLYVVDGKPTPSPIEARTRIGLTGSDLRDLYRRREIDVAGWLVVVSGLTDSPLPAGFVGEAERKLAFKTLKELGISELADRPYLELSQGQAQALLLARAMIRRPEWLFLDEAADGLDSHARRLLHKILIRLTDQGVGLAVATHQPHLLPDLGFEALVLGGGKAVFAGPLPEAAAHFAPKRKAAGGVRSSTARAAARRTPHAAPSGEPLVTVQGVQVLLCEREALSRIDWTLLPGENWVIAGKNGAGKSTFLKLLAGDLYPSSGTISRFGLTEPVSLWDLRERMGLVSWEWQAQYPADSTVRGVVVSGFFGSFGLYDTPGKKELALADDWLGRLGLSHLADRPIATLSQGQARRAMIGRALAFDPAVLLLDEPLGGLDPAARAGMLELLDDLAAQGRQLVMVTHGLDEIPSRMTHALVLDQGRIVAQGPLEKTLNAYDAG